jgi:hypothetical protein
MVRTMVIFRGGLPGGAAWGIAARQHSASNKRAKSNNSFTRSKSPPVDLENVWHK